MRFRPRKSPILKRESRFAWLPKRMANGTWVWLERYRKNAYREYGQ